MATGIAPEAVIKNCSVGLSTDSGANELPVHTKVLKPPNQIFIEPREIRPAPGEEIRPRLSKHVLHAVGNEPGGHDGQSETQQSRVEFP